MLCSDAFLLVDTKFKFDRKELIPSQLSFRQCGATLDEINYEGRTPFHEAADAGHVDVLESLMRHFRARSAASGPDESSLDARR